MADLHDAEREVIHNLMDLAELFVSGDYPGIAEWQRLSLLPPPPINGNHIWVRPHA